MRIEAAVREAGFGHHFGHGHGIEATLTKQPRRGVLDGLVVGFGLRFGNSWHR